MLISDKQLSMIKEDLIQSHSDLIIRGLLEDDARIELKKIVLSDHKSAVKDTETAEYIVSETVGTGVIEKILKENTDVTDIGFNGTHLIIETTKDKWIYQGKESINEEYIVRIVQKFANAVGKEFSPKNPNLSAVFGEIRLDAVHSARSGIGKTTMSLRVVRPKLMLNVNNFEMFAPTQLIPFFEKLIMKRTNIVISGQPGTGKTEFHKFLVNYIPFEDRAIMIEDVPETHIKELFPDKDIFSWIADEKWTITKAVKAAVRNNTRWIMVTETRDEAAFELVQGVMSGSFAVTSLHTINARAIPKRLVAMAQMGFNVNSSTLEEDIRTFFDLGFHIKKRVINGKTIRYLEEIVYFNPIKDITIFEQKIRNGKLEAKTYNLPDDLKNEFADYEIDSKFPENEEFIRLIE